jgi:hypothetical protein
MGSEARLLLAWADGTLPGGGGGVGGARFGLLLSLRAGKPQSEFRVLTVSLSQGHSIRTSPREHKVTSGALLTSDRELSTGRIFSVLLYKGYTTYIGSALRHGPAKLYS